MVTTVDLSDQELEDLKNFTQQSNASDAIRAAMRDYLRYARRMRLKELPGTVEMIDDFDNQELESESGDEDSD